MFDFFQSHRRKKILARPTPPSWIETLRTEVPYYSFLPEDDRLELLDDMKIFLAEKEFVGALNFEVTDEIKLIIAAYACMLLRHRKTDYYPLLDTIVVYPGVYVASVEKNDHGVHVVTQL